MDKTDQTQGENDPLANEMPRSPSDIADRGAHSSAAIHKDSGYSRTQSDLPPGDSPGGAKIATAAADEGEGSTPFDKTVHVENLRNTDWLISKASSIYTESTTYLETNITDTWERNLAHFNSEHSDKSQKNPKRSRLFRPKTRAMIKKSEAAMTVAAFSTQDYVQISAQDPTNEVQNISAAITKNIMQYRLDNRMPWFQTVIGAWQDTKNYGICITHNYWNFELDMEIVPVFDDEGKPLRNEDGKLLGEQKPTILVDEMCCDNVPPENLRFDPMCDWRNPASSSPYLVYLHPMYASDVQKRMQVIDPKTGAAAWREYSLDQIVATARNNYDRTRQAREGDKRVNPADMGKDKENTTVWAHMNILRVNGKDYVYWTLGTELLLTQPIPLTQAYPHLRRGERPFTIGTATIETHRNYPAGDSQQMAGIQKEINTIANQRMDNVKLVLNKRYFVRRGGQVDLDALIRNTPGGGVMMNDTDRDVKTISTNDVTSSSYQEQDRLAMEADDLTGNFSQGSAQPNNNNAGSVGGLSLMHQDAGAVGDYGIRVFMETWMAPTLKQFVRMIHKFETDEVILALAAKQSSLWKKFSVSIVTDEILQQELVMKVDIGIGMTDPMRRVERLLFAIERTAQLPGMAERLKSTKISDEIFGTLGYRDGARFYMSDEEMKEAGVGSEPPPDVALKQQELEHRRADSEARNEREMRRLEMEAQLGFAKLALEKEITLEKLYRTLGIEEQKIKTQRDSVAVREANKIHELAFAQKNGKGI